MASIGGPLQLQLKLDFPAKNDSMKIQSTATITQLINETARNLSIREAKTHDFRCVMFAQDAKLLLPSEQVCVVCVRVGCSVCSLTCVLCVLCETDAVRGWNSIRGNHFSWLSFVCQTRGTASKTTRNEVCHCFVCVLLCVL